MVLVVWVVKVGFVDECFGIIGMVYFFEYMMFKGMKIIGMMNIECDFEIIDEQEVLQDEICVIYCEQCVCFCCGEIDDFYVVEV